MLHHALTQLERSHHQRAKIDRQLGWQQGFPVRGDDDQGLSGREANSRLTRSIALAVEEILARPPSGDRPTDALAWQRLLSIADLCIESCMRSDSLYRKLTTTTTEITTYHEVNVNYSDSPTDVDMTAYGLARTRSTTPEPVPISPGQASTPDDEPDPRPVVDSMPELRGIDIAMRATMGFGVDAATGLINVARQWDATPNEPARCVLPDQIIDQCVEWTVGADRDQFVHALDWMTLRGADLAVEKIPHWETEKRHKRLLTSPFIADGEGVWVLPWTAESTMRVVVAYLGDGRLPWPQRSLPEEVTQSLLTHRQGRNRQLERECLAALQVGGLIARGSVKPHKCQLVGLTSLTGKIDVLCLDERRGRIWVIEVKDPYTPYSSLQIRRLVDDFEGADGYVAKLMMKVADVTRDADAVASALGTAATRTNWEVRGIMVTRHVEPAGFVVHPQVAFCSADRVEMVLNCDEIPGLGWNP